VKVNGDNHPSIMQQEGIQAMPTFKVYVNGKCEKTLKGADQNALRTAVAEAVAKVKSNGGNTGNAGVNKVLPQKPKGYQAYQPQGHKVFFENDKFETPLKKIAEFARKNGLFIGDYAIFEQKSTDLNFVGWENEEKTKFCTFLIENIPFLECDNCLPFVDMLSK